ncbi:hypothetical protein WR25_07108 [Diploscapter pachys]|uniref:Uncharacterized protein n=1 Tax=Diploscapter pachys TaxID=2018661 RepID=A0A2A2LKW7_9BILA|nr:hypothetical protein WR25_07108 [Diploscapter pachys]
MADNPFSSEPCSQSSDSEIKKMSDRFENQNVSNREMEQLLAVVNLQIREARELIDRAMNILRTNQDFDNMLEQEYYQPQPRAIRRDRQG